MPKQKNGQLVHKPLTVAQAADLLQCSEYTVRELCKSGRLPGIKPGEDWIIPVGAFYFRLDEMALQEAAAKRNTKALPVACVVSQLGNSQKIAKSRKRPLLPELHASN